MFQSATWDPSFNAYKWSLKLQRTHVNKTHTDQTRMFCIWDFWRDSIWKHWHFLTAFKLQKQMWSWNKAQINFECGFGIQGAKNYNVRIFQIWWFVTFKDGVCLLSIIVCFKVWMWGSLSRSLVLVVIVNQRRGVQILWTWVNQWLKPGRQKVGLLWRHVRK